MPRQVIDAAFLARFVESNPVTQYVTDKKTGTIRGAIVASQGLFALLAPINEPTLDTDKMILCRHVETLADALNAAPEILNAGEPVNVAAIF